MDHLQDLFQQHVLLIRSLDGVSSPSSPSNTTMKVVQLETLKGIIKEVSKSTGNYYEK